MQHDAVFRSMPVLRLAFILLHEVTKATAFTDPANVVLATRQPFQETQEYEAPSIPLRGGSPWRAYLGILPWTQANVMYWKARHFEQLHEAGPAE